MGKIFITGVLSFGLIGCTAPAYNYQATPKHVSKPPIGSVNTAYVGDKMLEQGVLVDRDVLSIPGNTKINFAYSLSAGYYQKVGQDKKGSYYNPVNNISNGGNVQKMAIADPFKAVMLGLDGKLCVITVFNAKNCTDQHSASHTSIGVAMDNSFQQTLIYSGKVGNKINIGYREFSSNMARPAFNNDVEYDLNESRQIGYKGALLDIIDANNQSITFKVLRNFNKPN